MFKKIDEMKVELDAQRPLPAAVVSNLREDLILRWTYHSNAIEGNTLTLMETKVVLEGITVGGRTMREHFEAINHRDAIFYVEEIVKNSESLTEWQIRNIHQLILRNIDNENAGRYRNVNVMISGAKHFPPDHTQLDQLMADFIRWYNEQADTLHSVERAARVHAGFVGIHPFIDGNGRTSRLLMNLELMKSGFPPAVLGVDQRLRYYLALDKANVDGDYTDFLCLIVECVERAFESYWRALKK